MVEVKEDTISIGDCLCLGIGPGRTANEILCSFDNGMIALYDFNTQRFVKNWQLNIADKLTTSARYDHTSETFRAIKNNNELIEWKNETEWASDFIVVELKFDVHSLLTTPTSCMIVYENGCIELISPRRVLSKGRKTNVVQVLYCETYHVIVMCQVISQYRYHFTFYDINEQQELCELSTTCDLSTDTLGDLVTMETSGLFLLTSWSSGVVVRSKLDPTGTISLDHHLVTLESSTGLTALASINTDCFTLLTDTKELRVYSVQYGTLQWSSLISSTVSSQQVTCCHGYIFVHLSTGLCGYPLVISEGMTLATAVGKRKKQDQLIFYQWNEHKDSYSSSEDSLLKLRGLIKERNHDVWSTDYRLLSNLTSLVEMLLNEEVWPRKELTAIIKAKVFPSNLMSSLLEQCLKQVDWTLLVTVLKYTEGLPEESLVELLIAILELDNDKIIKLSKKQTITKSELLSLVLSRFKNDAQIQQPLTNLSHDQVLVLLEFLAAKLDDATLTLATSLSCSTTLCYSDALEWFGLLLDTHFTHLIMVPRIRPLLLDLKKRFYRHSRYLSYLETIQELVQIGKSLTKDKCHDTQWNYKVEHINLNI